MKVTNLSKQTVTDFLKETEIYEPIPEEEQTAMEKRLELIKSEYARQMKLKESE